MKTQIQSRVGMGILVAVAAMGTQACSKMDALNKTSVGSSGSSVTPTSVSLKVTDPVTSTVIYTDTGASKTFSGVAGKTYTIKVSDNNALPLGATLSLVTQNTSVPGAAAITQAAMGSDVSFTPTIAGDYSVKIVVKDYQGNTLLTKNYAAGVSCQSPTFTASSLNASGISVSGSDNLYAYSASGAISGANGQAPYLCAYDLTGTGIVDTGFTDCTTAVTNQYSPLVQVRNVGVVVKDACNTSYSISKSVTLAAAVPAAPGNVFIVANVSAETGTAATDTRIKGAHYSATNTGGYNIVQPSWGNTNFTIQSFLNYGQASSVAYGMKIEVSGIGGTFNLTSNVNGAIDMSSAVVSKVTYITDQAGDQNPSATFTSTTCTTSGLHAVVQNPQGIPCTNGATGKSDNQATVEVYGDYTCTQVTSAGGSTVTLTGTFDGYTHLVDSCTGGGGGGGGVVPIRL